MIARFGVPDVRVLAESCVQVKTREHAPRVQVRHEKGSIGTGHVDSCGLSIF